MAHPFQILRRPHALAWPMAVLLILSCQLAQAASLTLTGEQEVPPVVVSGKATGEVNVAADGMVSGLVTTQGVNGTMAHIHQGALGQNGPIIVNLVHGDNGVWRVPPMTKLTTDQMAAFRASGLYVNVHTAANKGGEVRAQIVY